MTQNPRPISPERVRCVHNAANRWITQFSSGKDLEDPTNVVRKPTVVDSHTSYLEVAEIPEYEIDNFAQYVEGVTGVSLGRPTAQDAAMTSWSFLFRGSEEEEKDT